MLTTFVKINSIKIKNQENIEITKNKLIKNYKNYTPDIKITLNKLENIFDLNQLKSLIVENKIYYLTIEDLPINKKYFILSLLNNKNDELKKENNYYIYKKKYINNEDLFVTIISIDNNLNLKKQDKNIILQKNIKQFYNRKFKYSFIKENFYNSEEFVFKGNINKEETINIKYIYDNIEEIKIIEQEFENLITFSIIYIFILLFIALYKHLLYMKKDKVRIKNKIISEQVNIKEYINNDINILDIENRINKNKLLTLEDDMKKDNEEFNIFSTNLLIKDKLESIDILDIEFNNNKLSDTYSYMLEKDIYKLTLLIMEFGLYNEFFDGKHNYFIPLYKNIIYDIKFKEWLNENYESIYELKIYINNSNIIEDDIEYFKNGLKIEKLTIVKGF
jgi:hypothetical protein